MRDCGKEAVKGLEFTLKLSEKARIGKLLQVAPRSPGAAIPSRAAALRVDMEHATISHGPGNWITAGCERKVIECSLWTG